MAFTEDISLFFADFGVEAVFGASSAQVLLDEPDNTIFEGQLVAADASITYATGDLEGLQKGSSLTVDGNAYKVTQPPMKIDDGKLMRAQVAEV
jgi:hypothetical protein